MLIVEQASDLKALVLHILTKTRNVIKNLQGILWKIIHLSIVFCGSEAAIVGVPAVSSGPPLLAFIDGSSKITLLFLAIMTKQALL